MSAVEPAEASDEASRRLRAQELLSDVQRRLFRHAAIIEEVRKRNSTSRGSFECEDEATIVGQLLRGADADLEEIDDLLMAAMDHLGNDVPA